MQVTLNESWHSALLQDKDDQSESIYAGLQWPIPLREQVDPTHPGPHMADYIITDIIAALQIWLGLSWRELWSKTWKHNHGEILLPGILSVNALGTLGRFTKHPLGSCYQGGVILQKACRLKHIYGPVNEDSSYKYISTSDYLSLIVHQRSPKGQETLMLLAHKAGIIERAPELNKNQSHLEQTRTT